MELHQQELKLGVLCDNHWQLGDSLALILQRNTSHTSSIWWRLLFRCKIMTNITFAFEAMH